MASPAGHDELLYRQDYFADPRGWAALVELLRDIFSIDVGIMERFGGPDPSSMPCGYFDRSGALVANLSAVSMPLVIDGRPVKAAGLQSGAVRPAFRGRGLFGDLIRRVLARCDAAGFEAVLLLTDKPDLYRRHGFEAVPQYKFSGPPPAPAATRPAARRLRLGEPDDLALVRALLATRTAVSHRFAVTDQASMFLLNAHLDDRVRLDHLPTHAAVVAWRPGDTGVFELLDVVAADIPPLAAILAALDPQPDSVEAHVPPDRLAWQGEAVRQTGDMALMMRCPSTLVRRDGLALSPMASF